MSSLPQISTPDDSNVASSSMAHVQRLLRQFEEEQESAKMPSTVEWARQGGRGQGQTRGSGREGRGGKQGDVEEEEGEEEEGNNSDSYLEAVDGGPWIGEEYEEEKVRVQEGLGVGRFGDRHVHSHQHHQPRRQARVHPYGLCSSIRHRQAVCGSPSHRSGGWMALTSSLQPA